MISTTALNGVFILVGALYVVWVAWSKFNRWPPSTTKRPEMAPRAYTSATRFMAFLGMYALGYLTVYGAACFAPELVDTLVNDVLSPDPPIAMSAMGKGERALFAAFVLTGFIPNIPALKNMDHRARRYLHDRARIPGSARALIEELSEETTFRPNMSTFDRFRKQIALSLNCAPQQIESGACPTLDRFLKLAYFTNRLHKWESKPSKNQFLSRNCTLYEPFMKSFESLQDKIRRYCTIDRNNPLLPDYEADLDKQTERLLHDALEIICCGINRTTPNKTWHSTEFKFFSLYPELRSPGVLGTETITRTLVGVAGAVLVTGVGTYFLHRAMHGTATIIPEPKETLRWTAYAITIHGLAITLVSLYHMSRSLYLQNKGYNPAKPRPLSVFECVVGFLLGAMAGAFLFLTVHYVRQYISSTVAPMNMNILCWTVCPGATGAFISYYIQSMRRLDLAWYWYALMQGLGTMSSVLLAAVLVNPGTVLAGNRPFMLLAGFVVGATIGGIFPTNYKKRLVALGMRPSGPVLLAPRNNSTVKAVSETPDRP